MHRAGDIRYLCRRRAAERVPTVLVLRSLLAVLLTLCIPLARSQSFCAGHRLTCLLDPLGAASCVVDNSTGLFSVPTAMLPSAAPSGRWQHIHCSFTYVCALSKAGYVSCWGAYIDQSNKTELEGVLTAAPSAVVPTSIPFSSISTGGNHACGIQSGSARLICWAGGLYGNEPVDITIPLTVTQERIKTVACGLLSVLAITENGTTYCWPAAYCQATSKPGAVQASLSTLGTCIVYQSYQTECLYALGFYSVTLAGLYNSVSVGEQSFCALASDGAISCSSGELGQTPVPRDVYTHVSVGLVHACASTSTGFLRCWGRAPVIPHDGKWTGGWSSIVTGLSSSHICAIADVNHTLTCWGDDSYGQTQDPIKQPVLSVCTGPTFTCALSAPDGRLSCWGAVSVNVTAWLGLPFRAIACGVLHMAGVMRDGSAVCSAQQSDAPGRVQGECVLPNISDTDPLVSVSAGWRQTCWLKRSGRLWCVDRGQNIQTNNTLWANMTVTQVFSGYYDTCVINQMQRAWCVGTAWSGPDMLVEADPSHTVSTIALGVGCELFLRTDGTLLCRSTQLGLCPAALQDARYLLIASGAFMGAAVRAVDSSYVSWGTANLASQPSPVSVLPYSTPQFTYAIGLLQAPCAPGTYSLGVGSGTPLCSGPCAVGRYGSVNQTSPMCTGECPAGSYCPAGSARPLPCPAGFFNVFTGSGSCDALCPPGYFCPEGTVHAVDHPCPAGRYGSGGGLTNSSCSGECPAGYYCPRGSVAPYDNECGDASLFCPAGCATLQLAGAGNYTIGVGNIANTSSVTTRTDQVPCQAGQRCVGGRMMACPLGRFTSSTGASQCVPCPAGSASPIIGAFNCQPCGPGFFMPIDGAADCLPCSPGTYQPKGNQTVCLTCDAGSFARYFNSTACANCSVGQFQSQQGASECSPCLPGFYMFDQAATECRDCRPVKGAVCAEGVIRALPGFYVYRGANGSLLSKPCHVTGTCRGGLLDDQCTAHRLRPDVNPLCALCEAGASEWGRHCVPCSSANGGMLVGIILLSWLFVLLVMYTSQTSSSGTFDIAMYFLQTSVLVAGPLSEWVQGLSVLNSNGKDSFGICLFPLDPYQKIALDAFDPILPALQLAIIMGVHAALDAHTSGRIPLQSGRCALPLPPFSWTKYAHTWMALLLLSYSRVSLVALQYLRCISIEHTSVLQAHRAVDCSSPTYLHWRPFFITLLITVVIGLPLGLAALFIRNRRQAKQFYRADPASKSSHHLTVFANLVSPYREQCFWWIVVILYRRLLTALIFTFVSGEIAWPLAMVAAVHLCSLCAQALIQPYALQRNNRMELVLLATLLMIIYVILVLPEPPYQLTQRVLISVLVIPTSVCAILFSILHVQRVHALLQRWWATMTGRIAWLRTASAGSVTDSRPVTDGNDFDGGESALQADSSHAPYVSLEDLSVGRELSSSQAGARLSDDRDRDHDDPVPGQT